MYISPNILKKSLPFATADAYINWISSPVTVVPIGCACVCVNAASRLQLPATCMRHGISDGNASTNEPIAYCSFLVCSSSNSILQYTDFLRTIAHLSPFLIFHSYITTRNTNMTDYQLWRSDAQIIFTLRRKPHLTYFIYYITLFDINI